MKIGRNDICPCGSGKKYKYCCMDKVLLSYDEAKAVYLKQLSLMKNLNDENCTEIINCTKNILKSTKKYIFSTGACVNAARAYLHLWYVTKEEKNVLYAKEMCNEALTLKPENQQAALVLYEIYLNICNFNKAAQILMKIRDKDIVEQGQAQIITLYQCAIETANKGIYTIETKKGLLKLTDTLFDKYGKNAGLCGVATSFYLGIGDDVLKAYESAKNCVEQWPNAEMFCTLGLICLYPQINRISESIDFLNKGLKICKNDSLKYGLKSNLLASLIQNKQFDKAFELAGELVTTMPSNMNYHNYAELLKRKGNYNKAIHWCRKALFLIEDDSTLLTLADIYKRSKKFDKAIETYILCFSSQENNENALLFDDANGKSLYSIANNTAISDIKYEAFKGIIYSYIQLQDYESARAFLSLAEENVPEKSEWEIWETTIPKLDKSIQAYNNAKKKLNEELNKNNKQRNYFKQWASHLIQLQDNCKNIDLDKISNWEEYESKMDFILEEMKKSIINHNEVYSKMDNLISVQFPNLGIEAKKFLVTANLLYDIHQDSIIDFAPIIVEYSKVVEKQLRILLRNQLSTSDKMLGQIIGKIDTNSISPYVNYLTDLRAVNKLRKSSAHTGLLTKSDADSMRKILFTNNLLTKLC
ncbi:TPA: SEC-C domain-containing protein [Clostridium botulinum]|nr:SEC-C domain-containing protein [Clostridium botulinum]HCL4448477.1 SEC-C domain-containing protein [Clostridium botulinum]HCL4458726.1 SEC-C domain-containing protein [Clostridium botulinum]HCL4459635.1 SEC-C domain-containing protein [Clostridium botulinum]HCL4462638.1 SEC-C domain-containing protein [Clostridium botulinum]